MKKKLLHERLRDWKYSNEAAISVLTGIEAEAFAGEIEEYYIPRPRYEDGEPVQFKNEFVDHNGHNQTLSSLTYTKGSHDYVSLNGWTKQRLDEPVKRPEAKVLDANGVEIDAGCLVVMEYDRSCEKFVAYVGTNAATDPRCIHSRARPEPFVVYEDGGWDYARSVSHIEPDSLEKLRDDIASYVSLTDHQSKPSEWADRLTALMERDA